MLGEMTLRFGNTTPAYAVFNRFMKRFEQQVTFITNELKASHFTFDGADRYLLNRHDSPRPRTETESRDLWRERLRYEYLGELLNLVKPAEITQTLRKRLGAEKPEKLLAGLRAARAKTVPQTGTNSLRLTNAVTLALDGKLSDERASEVSALFEAGLGRQPLDAILKSVQARVEERNRDEIDPRRDACRVSPHAPGSSAASGR